MKPLRNVAGGGGLRGAVLVAGLVVAGCGGAKDASEPDEAAGEAGVRAGAGGEQSPAESGSRSLEPMAILPGDAVALVRIDVERLRESPYADRLTEWVSSLGQRRNFDQETADAFEEIYERTDRVVAAILPPPAAGEREHFVAVMRGDYREPLLERWLREGAKETGEPVETERRGGREVLVIGAVGAVALADDTWVLASAGRLDKAMARARRPAEFTVLSSDSLGSMAKRVGFRDSALAAVVQTTDRIRRQMRRSGGLMPSDSIDAMRVFGLRFDAGDGVDLKSVARLADGSAAERLTRYADRYIREYADHPIAHLLGLSALFQGATVRADGAHSILRLQLDDRETRALLARVDKLLRQLASSSSGQGASFRFQFGSGGAESGPSGSSTPKSSQSGQP